MSRRTYHYEDRPNNHVSVFPYPGGKGRQSDWILSKMPPHKCYVEVFGGSGGLLYNKEPSHNEVYNDINDDLVQFFNVLREREDDLLEWVRRVPYSRALYDEWVEQFFNGYRPDGEIARAGRFFTLRYMQFAGDMAGPNGFKVRNSRSPARTFDNGRERLQEIANRFRQVIIENRDWSEILEGYDADHVLFYCDPPYVDAEHYYGQEFDHASFVDALAGLEGDWMVSYCELPDGLEEVGHVVERDRRHRMARGSKKVTERLVCSFDPDETKRFVDAEHEQTRLGGMA